jgi:hypothetical protein
MQNARTWNQDANFILPSLRITEYNVAVSLLAIAITGRNYGYRQGKNVSGAVRLSYQKLSTLSVNICICSMMGKKILLPLGACKRGFFRISVP